MTKSMEDIYDLFSMGKPQDHKGVWKYIVFSSCSVTSLDPMSSFVKGAFRFIYRTFSCTLDCTINIPTYLITLVHGVHG